MEGRWRSICAFLVKIEAAVFVLAFVAWAKPQSFASVTFIRLSGILQQQKMFAMTGMFNLG
jgi:hypothetical protein